MPNRVVLSQQGLIEHYYEGDQTAELLAPMIEKTNDFGKQLAAQGKPALLLMDLHKLGKLSTATRRASVRALHEMAYNRIAMFGASAFNKALVNLIAYSANKTHVVHVFDSRDDAIRWLKAYGR